MWTKPAEALPGVTVTARDVSTGNVYLGVTDGTGAYRIGAMRPGEYTVEAVLSGFATLIHEQVVLAVGQAGTLDFNMTVAAVEETVTVTGESPLVDLQQSSLGGAINPLQMEALPINGRDWVQLTMMAPGSRKNNTDAGFSPSGRWATDFQINLDGQPVSQTWSSASLGQPRFSRDAIAGIRGGQQPVRRDAGALHRHPGERGHQVRVQPILGLSGELFPA